MDPDETLKEIQIAINEGNFRKASEYAEYLKTWLSKDGFPPMWSRRPVATNFFQFYTENTENGS